MKSIKNTARIAGVLYLLVIVFGIFGEKYVRNTLVNLADGQQTIVNITQNEFLFRLGFVSDLLMQLAYFLLPLVLYCILKKTNKWLAQTMVLGVTVAVAIMCVNMLNHYAPLVLLDHSILDPKHIPNDRLFRVLNGFCIVFPLSFEKSEPIRMDNPACRFRGVLALSLSANCGCKSQKVLSPSERGFRRGDLT